MFLFFPSLLSQFELNFVSFVLISSGLCHCFEAMLHDFASVIKLFLFSLNNLVSLQP